MAMKARTRAADGKDTAGLEEIDMRATVGVCKDLSFKEEYG